uniref:Reverse transcriptase Ty1/copia-type domain-containing protein n=1 Tax=Solanum lycopersicum TaxID=4081 RepID=A0A3Q7FJM0_SOLLC
MVENSFQDQLKSFSMTELDNSSIDGGSTTREVLPKPPYIDIEDSQHNEIDDVLLDGIHDLENISDGESDNHAADPETQDALESPDASGTILLFLYVDDIVIAGSSLIHIQEIITALGNEFSMKDHGPVQFFLGIERVLNQFGMKEKMNSVSTPLAPHFKLSNAM